MAAPPERPTTGPRMPIQGQPPASTTIAVLFYGALTAAIWLGGHEIALPRHLARGAG